MDLTAISNPAFLKDKSVLDMDLLFDKYPNEYFPFNYDTYFKSESECEMVVLHVVI